MHVRSKLLPFWNAKRAAGDVKGFDVNKKLCTAYPNTDCNPTYGASINRGSFHLKAGGWTTVSERDRLNTPGKADGELELFVGGQSFININGLIIRDGDEGGVRGIQIQSFFGVESKGHDTNGQRLRIKTSVSLIFPLPLQKSFGDYARADFGGVIIFGTEPRDRP